MYKRNKKERDYMYKLRVGRPSEARQEVQKYNKLIDKLIIKNFFKPVQPKKHKNKRQ